MQRVSARICDIWLNRMAAIAIVLVAVVVVAVTGCSPVHAAIMTTGTVTPSYDGTDPWEIPGALRVATSKAGTVTVTNGSEILSDTGRIAPANGTNGAVTLTGAGSGWTISGDLGVSVPDASTAGTGLLRIEDEAFVDVGGTLEVRTGGTILLDGGVITTGNFTRNTGVLNFRDGTLIVDGGVFRYSGDLEFGHPLIDGHPELRLTNQATTQQINNLTLDRGASLTIEGGSSMSNGVGWIMDGAGTVHVTGPGSTWTNSGELRVGHAFIIDGAGSGLPDDGDESLGSGSSHETGNRLLITDGGSVSSASGVIGVFHNGAPAVLGEAIVTGSSSTWTNSGNLSVQGGTLTIENDALVHIGGTLTIQDTVNLDGGTLRFNGYSRGANSTFNYQSGTIQLAGNRTVGTDSVIDDLFGDTPIIPAGKGLIVEGTAGIRGLVHADGGTFKSGNMNVGSFGAGTLTVENGASVDISGTMTVNNIGTVQFTGGILIASTIDHTNGGAFNFTGGTLQVNSFDGNLINQGGRLAPGNSPGITTIDGDYTQQSDGVLEIEVGGLTPGTQHDEVIVTGNATLDGRLDVPIIDGFVPVPGNQLKFLSAATVEGQFDSVFSPNLGSVNPNVAIELVPGATDVQIHFVQPRTDIQFDADTGTALWSDSNTWSTGSEPDTRHIINVQNLAGVPQRVEVLHQGAFVHELNIEGNSNPITISVENGNSLSAVAGTTIADQAIVELNSGNLVSSTVHVDDGGLLAGNGTVVGNLIVGATAGMEDATLRLGFSVGQLEVRGDYQQGANGTLLVDVEGGMAGQFDTIAVEGEVALGGTLVVDASNLVGPAGTTVELITAGSVLAGTGFDSIQTVGRPDIFFAATYLADTVILTNFPIGDMNRSGGLDVGDVDEFALALMNSEAYFGLRGVEGSQAGNMNGTGGLDFSDIRPFAEAMRLAGVLNAAAAIERALASLNVPEPDTIVLITFAALVWMGRSRKTRS